MTPDELKVDLEQRISNSTSLRYMTETPGWEFLRTWLNDNIETYDKALKSNAFVDDHNGYLNARALYVSTRNLIEFVEGTINDGDGAKRELDELERPGGEQPTS